MTTYRVEFELSAARALKKLDRGTQRRIVEAVEALTHDPRPAGAIKLTGMNAMRIRVGQYRVIYLVEDAIVTVTVVKVGHRSTIYER